MIGKEIQLKGILHGNTFFVVDPNQLAIKSTNALSPPTVSSPANNLKIGVIVFRFKNEISTPNIENTIRNFMFTDTKSVKSYYLENSFGQATLDGDVLGEYVLPYNPSTSSCDFDKWSQDAYQLAVKKVIDIAGYNSFIYVSEHYENLCFYRATAEPLGNTIYINGAIDSYNFSHEMGHKFGLKHANAYDCDKNTKSIDTDDKCISIEYADNYDVMGRTVDSALNHFNAVHKMETGWLSANQIIHFTDNGQYSIKPLEQSAGSLVIKIPKDQYTDPTGKILKRYYIVSYRQPIGFDSDLPSSITTGASIHIKTESIEGSDPIAPDFSNFIDTTANNTDQYEFIYKEFLDAVLTDGNSFTDSLINISIKQISHDQDGVVLEINKAISSIDPNLDTDNDGFKDVVEISLGTDPNKSCPVSSIDNAWPPDVNNDGVVNHLDQSSFAQYIKGQVPYNMRFDLNMDGAVSKADIDLIQPYFLKSCSAL